MLSLAIIINAVFGALRQGGLLKVDFILNSLRNSLGKEFQPEQSMNFMLIQRYFYNTSFHSDELLLNVCYTYSIMIGPSVILLNFSA